MPTVSSEIAIPPLSKREEEMDFAIGYGDTEVQSLDNDYCTLSSIPSTLIASWRLTLGRLAGLAGSSWCRAIRALC